MLVVRPARASVHAPKAEDSDEEDRDSRDRHAGSSLLGISSPQLGFAAATVAVFAAYAGLIGTASHHVVMPVVATMFLAFAAVFAVVAWRRRAEDPTTVTHADVAGALTLIGLFAAATIDPDQLVRIVAETGARATGSTPRLIHLATTRNQPGANASRRANVDQAELSTGRAPLAVERDCDVGLKVDGAGPVFLSPAIPTETSVRVRRGLPVNASLLRVAGFPSHHDGRRPMAELLH